MTKIKLVQYAKYAVVGGEIHPEFTQLKHFIPSFIQRLTIDPINGKYLKILQNFTDLIYDK